MASKQRDIPRVAVLVETSTTWGRSVFAGIQHYADNHGQWLTFIEPRGMEESAMLPHGWRGDGVIARVVNKSLANDLRSMKIPVVNVSGIQVPGCSFPRVTTNLSISGKLAAEYFLNRGFSSFAYFSMLGLHYVATHQQAFTGKLKEASCDCAVYSVRPRRGAEPNWNLDLAELGNWLKSLQKPVAVLSWNASSSREVLFACKIAGVLVPEEVSILSGTDDDLLCALAHIPISGVKSPAEQVGARAAELLDKLMHRKAIRDRTILLPPSGITSRQSTDTLAIGDFAMLKALNFIRENKANQIKVDDIAHFAGISRRVLERRFETILGRSPALEIRRIHLEQAKELLTVTDMPIPDVAWKSGFGSPEYLSYIFRREIGQTPLKYRRSIRNV